MKTISCPNCDTGLLCLSRNKQTGEPFVMCSNGYSCYHGNIPEGYTEDDFEEYTPNLDNSLADWINRKLEEDD
jgi:hypothetical protein